ncbi:MAG: hypothetical protein U9Q69_01600 [Nanoarchaeota archaeon]|nr:hypothetical protein [Nanoarchaeota archaeon]
MKFWENLFKKEVKQEVVDFFELSKWIINNINTLKKLDTHFAEMEKLLNKTGSDLEKLEAVNLEDKKVEKRLKAIVEGNKPAYIRNVRYSLKKLAPPQKYDLKSITKFVEDCENELKELNKKTSRNFYILNNLIGDELTEIAKNIKKIDILNDMIKKPIKSGEIERYEGLQKNIAEIYQYIINKKELTKRAKELTARKEFLFKKEGEYNKKIQSLKTSKEFKELMKLKSQKTDLIEKEYELRSKILTHFGFLKRPFKKFNNEEQIKILSSYITQPYETFVNDGGLQINKILEDLKEALAKDKIKIKNKEKALGVLSLLTPSLLKNLKESIKDLKEDLKDVNKKLKANKFQDEELKYSKKLSQIIDEINEISEKLAKSKKRDLSRDIKQIKEDLDKLTSVKVVLKNVPLD